METTAGAGAAAEVSIRMPAGAGELQRRESAAAKLERRLNRFVRFVAFGEWAGNAFGALAFLWATGVLLGGFCTSLKPEDFWFATVMIFIEAFRIFSRSYRLDNQSLFGTTGALRWISSYFFRMLRQPQEGDEVVVIMGLWIKLFDQLTYPLLFGLCASIVEVALLILLSRRPRRPRQWQMWALLIVYSVVAPYQSFRFYTRREDSLSGMLNLRTTMITDITTVVAVLLLGLRPRRIVNLTSTPCGRKLLSLAKLISAAWLPSGLVLVMFPSTIPLTTPAPYYNYLLSVPFTIVVLSLGSLQNPAHSPFRRWTDAIMHISFLLLLVLPLFPEYLTGYVEYLDESAAVGLSILILLMLLLIGNLQIPAAIVQVLLSSVRFHDLLAHGYDYYPGPEGSTDNMVLAATNVFYVLAQCQGSLYIMASILGVFSFFPRRSLVRQSKLCGTQGVKAISLYYQCAYTTCMDTGLLTARKTISLASFTVESLRSSSSSEVQLAGVLLLDNLLSQETNSSQDLKSRIIRSNEALSMLIGMLGWSDVRDRDIRFLAARVTAKLAGSIRVALFPGTVKLVSSLLDAGNKPLRQQDSLLNRAQVTAACLTNGETDRGNQPLGQGPSTETTSGIAGLTWIHRYWQRTKERWSIPEDLPLTHEDSFPFLGMVILEKLACDLDNCTEMLKDKTLFSKIIRLIRYDTTDIYEQQIAVTCSSLNFLRRLATTGEKIGVALRQELWKNNFLLNNLVDILEDSRSSSELLEPVMVIIGGLALDKRAGRQIGRTQVIIGRLLHVFLGKDRASDTYYVQSLRTTAGEALANLAIWGTANCSSILAEPGYEVIKDIRNLLCEDNYRNVAASLLQNICAHCRDKLRHQGASEHLSSVLPEVMENIMSAKGRELESLIGLASQMSDIIPESFLRELESHINAAVLSQNLVCTLNSNKKPNPEYPRMRRVVIETVISIVKSCPRYATILRDAGMMEALSKVERTPSNVEKYRVFYGNFGVVLESGTSLPVLVAKAKKLIDSADPV